MLDKRLQPSFVGSRPDGGDRDMVADDSLRAGKGGVGFRLRVGEHLFEIADAGRLAVRGGERAESEHEQCDCCEGDEG